MAAGAREASADLLWFGVHGAYYSEFEKGALGLNAREDVGDSWSVGLLGDWVFRSGRTTVAVNIDLQYEAPFLSPQFTGWVGAGGGVLLDDIEGLPEADYEPLAVGFAGVGTRGKPVMPYAEVRFMAHHGFRTVFYLGVRF
jgi:hypothetical protein